MSKEIPQDSVLKSENSKLMSAIRKAIFHLENGDINAALDALENAYYKLDT